MTSWLSNHKFQAHLAAFSLMVLTSIGMVLSINVGSNGLIWGLLAIFVVANILAMVTK